MMDIAWPTTLVFWHWWILAAVMLLFELLAPGIFFLWTGLAALLTGAVVLLLPGLAWEIQALVFAALAVVTTLAGRRIWRPGAAPTDHPLLNRRAHRHVGKLVTLTVPLRDGRGRARVGDGEWSVVAEPDTLALEAGATVRVIDVRDGDLVVSAESSA
jgi:membrane protein implicated in regulation of membrane protease activity